MMSTMNSTTATTNDAISRKNSPFSVGQQTKAQLKAKRPSKRYQELDRQNKANFQQHARRAYNCQVVRPGSVDIDSLYEEEPDDLMTRFTNNVRRINHKNSHKPRGRYGRGFVKKNSASGSSQFAWGIATNDQVGCIDPLSDYNDIDPSDPNYDSDSEDNCKFEAITPPLEDDEVEDFIEPIVVEYLEHGDTSEVACSLEEANLAQNYHQILVVIVTVAMERKAYHRELASILISDLYGRILTTTDIERGFDHLLSRLSDLALDTPDAASVLGCFLARAVADDCIPPKYVSEAKEELDSKLEQQQQASINKTDKLAAEALNHANTLIYAKRGLILLDTVWGLTGGARPVKYLIKQMRLLLKEYLTSLDIDEAKRCLTELEVPHFYHEFVYEAVLMAIEDSKQVQDIVSIAKLLKDMSDTNLLSVDQLKKGFLRIFDEMPEISIDVPHAYSTLEKFMQTCFDQSLFLPRDVVNNVPSRGRKRFISEGDGGKIKE